MKSTQAMRDRCRELSKPDRDDYDRAVICIIDDLETLQARVEELEAARGMDLRECAAQLDQNTVTMDVARARIEALEAALANERERCIAVCESWIGTFQQFEVKCTGAREYAIAAIEDIVEFIREGHDPRAALDKDAAE
jgi:hypothetical protein